MSTDEIKPQDISVESYREYRYGNGDVYRINQPEALYVMASGGHRVVDQYGVTHAPARPWAAITFKQRDGKPFSF